MIMAKLIKLFCVFMACMLFGILPLMLIINLGGFQRPPFEVIHDVPAPAAIFGVPFLVLALFIRSLQRRG